MSHEVRAHPVPDVERARLFRYALDSRFTAKTAVAAALIGLMRIGPGTLFKRDATSSTIPIANFCTAVGGETERDHNAIALIVDDAFEDVESLCATNGCPPSR